MSLLCASCDHVIQQRENQHRIDVVTGLVQEDFLPEKCWLAVSIFDNENRESSSPVIIRADGGSFLISFIENREYLLVFRLYAVGLKGVDNYGFSVSVDDVWQSRVAFRTNDYFLSFSRIMPPQMHLPPQSTIRFRIIDASDIPGVDTSLTVVRERRGIMMASETNVRRAIPLPEGETLEIPWQIGMTRLSFDVWASHPDAKITLDMTCNDTIRHTGGSLLKRALSSARRSGLVNEDSLEKQEIVLVTFAADNADDTVMAQAIPLDKDGWNHVDIDLTRISGKSGALSITLARPPNAPIQQNHNTITALTDIVLEKISSEPPAILTNEKNISTSNHQTGARSPIMPERPHIVIVSMDTVRSHALGCYGNPWIKTPNLDRFSRQNTTVIGAMSQTNLTLPSHVSMVYAVPPRVHGVYLNTSPLPFEIRGFDWFFEKMGYCTVSAVSAYQLNPWTTGFLRDTSNVFHCPTVQKSAAQTIRPLLNWLDISDQLNRLPMFLFLHLMDAHTNYSPPILYGRMYYERDPTEGDTDTLLDREPFLREKPFRTWYSSWLKDVRDDDYPVALYYGEISFLDSELAPLLAAFTKPDRKREAIIIVTADHGESLGEHGIFYDHWGMWQNNYDIPLLCRFPDCTMGAILDVPVQHIDLGPTLFRFLNIPIPKLWPGLALEFNNRLSPKDNTSVLHGRTRFLESSMNTAVAVIKDGQKLVIPLQQRRFYSDDEQFFDLIEDPREMKDILSDHHAPVLGDGLRQEYQTWCDMSASQKGDSQTLRTDERLRQALAALGYIDE